MTDLRRFRPRAVVFDLDGTLTNNMAWHTQAFDAFASRHGLPALTLEMRRRIDGKRNREIFPLLFKREMTIEEIRAFEEEKEGGYRTLSRGGLTPMAGAVRLLDRLAAHSIAVAIATSAPEENVAHTLAETGLAERIALIVRGDQVPLGKPAPDIYLRAARVLDVNPMACLAFEDAPLGVTAARSAGMPCVAITSTFPAEIFAASIMPPDESYADFDAFLDGAGRWLLG